MFATQIRSLVLAFLAVGSFARVAGAELVAHWPFDETSGATAADAVGGNNGSLVSFPGDDSQWQPGVIGNALLFDGVDDHVVHAFNLPRSEGTIAHWLNPTVVGDNLVTVYESDSPGPGGVLYDGFGDSAIMLEIHSGVTENWQARYHDGDGTLGNNAAGGGRFNAPNDLVLAAANVWTHVAMTWDTASDLVLYVNCQEIGRVRMADGEFDGLATTERFIGRPSAATRFWNGLIDDVRIYDTALTQSEIVAAAQFCPEEPVTAIAVPTLAGSWLAILSAGLAGLGWLLLTRRR
jgi:hypothetical protein